MHKCGEYKQKEGSNMANNLEVTTQDYKDHRFYISTHPDGNYGYSFPINEDGSLPIEDMEQPAIENFAMCLFPSSYDKDGNAVLATGETIYFTEPQTFEWTVTTRIVTCKCGEKVDVTYEQGHGTDCEKCGRIYSWTGQQLKPRSQWDDRWDDESTQPYCVEFGYSGNDY